MYKTIEWAEIQKVFEKEKDIYHIGFLSNEELKQLCNYPTKEQSTEFLDQVMQTKILIHNYSNISGLIISINENKYSLNDEKFGHESYIEKIKKIPNLIYSEKFYCSKKPALVLAELGQYGKNQLIYDFKFGFDIYPQIILIFNPIKNAPIHNKPNWDYMNMCNNCYDCIIHCPVSAIHIDEKRSWLDEFSCRNFSYFGNHPTIPSIKYGINQACINPPLPEKEIEKISNNIEWEKKMGSPLQEYCFFYQGKQYRVEVDNCRECLNQPKCRKKDIKYDKRGIYHKKFIVEETNGRTVYKKLE